MRGERGIGQLATSDGSLAIEVSYRLIERWRDGRPIEGSFRARRGAILPPWAADPYTSLRLTIEDGQQLQLQITKHWPSNPAQHMVETVTFFGDFMSDTQ